MKVNFVVRDENKALSEALNARLKTKEDELRSRLERIEGDIATLRANAEIESKYGDPSDPQWGMNMLMPGADAPTAEERYAQRMSELEVEHANVRPRWEAIKAARASSTNPVSTSRVSAASSSQETS